jgi:hypothetical protein
MLLVHTLSPSNWTIFLFAWNGKMYRKKICYFLFFFPWVKSWTASLCKH